MPRLAWLNGRLVSLDEPHISITDRGFQLGDGLFEALRARRGVLIEWPEHIARLRSGADILAISLVPDEVVAAGIAELLEGEGLAARDGQDPGDAAVRITVTRGPLGARGTLPRGWASGDPTVAIQAWPYAPPPARLLEVGVRAVTSAVRRDPASPLAGVKSTSRADYVVAKLEAERAGAEDAIFVTFDGRLSEATSSNLFAVIDGRLVTPPLTAAILAGTTRTWLLEHPAVPALGLVPVVADLRPGELLAADEAFLSASVSGILPLTTLDGAPIGTGRPGPWSLELREARERWIEEASLAGRPPADATHAVDGGHPAGDGEPRS